jgi:hypothetical protein
VAFTVAAVTDAGLAGVVAPSATAGFVIPSPAAIPVTVSPGLAAFADVICCWVVLRNWPLAPWVKMAGYAAAIFTRNGEEVPFRFWTTMSAVLPASSNGVSKTIWAADTESNGTALPPITTEVLLQVVCAMPALTQDTAAELRLVPESSASSPGASPPAAPDTLFTTELMLGLCAHAAPVAAISRKQRRDLRNESQLNLHLHAELTMRQ